MSRKQFSVHIDLWTSIKFPQLLLFSAMFPLNYKFLYGFPRLSYFEKIGVTGRQTDRRTGATFNAARKEGRIIVMFV